MSPSSNQTAHLLVHFLAISYHSKAPRSIRKSDGALEIYYHEMQSFYRLKHYALEVYPEAEKVSIGLQKKRNQLVQHSSTHVHMNLFLTIAGWQILALPNLDCKGQSYFIVTIYRNCSPYCTIDDQHDWHLFEWFSH